MCVLACVAGTNMALKKEPVQLRRLSACNMLDIPVFAHGLALGWAVFICPGPKDVLIVQQALLGRSAVFLIAVGFISDALLIWLGLAGVAAALQHAPGLQRAALWLGVGLLLMHSVLAMYSALRGHKDVPHLCLDDRPAECPTDNPTDTPSASAGKSAKAASLSGAVAVLVASFINPVAWLDTVLIISTVGASLPADVRLSFASGAVTASFAWFLLLVLGARYVARWMTQPKYWRMLDVGVAAAMLAMAMVVGSGLAT